MEELFKFHGYIYITINQYNNKVYVGQKTCSPEKSKKYFGSGRIIRGLIKKYGKNLFKKIVLGEIFSNDVLDFKRQLDDCETECIYFFRAYGADGENHDQIYGYNLTKEGSTTLGLPKEILVKSVRKRQETIKNDPNIVKLQVEHFKQTIKNDPNIIVERVESYKKAIKEDPSIREGAIHTRKETWDNKPEEEKEIWRENISKTKQSKTDEEITLITEKQNSTKAKHTPERKKETRDKKREFLKNNPDSEKNRLANLKITLDNNPDIVKNRGITASKTIANKPIEEKRLQVQRQKETKIKNKTSVGKKNCRFKQVNYVYLIINYFVGLHAKVILEEYNKNNIEISTDKYCRFLKILSFPSNFVSVHSTKKARTDYYNFIEENKHKIQWYIDNYERLEEEYYEGLHTLRHSTNL